LSTRPVYHLPPRSHVYQCYNQRSQPVLLATELLTRITHTSKSTTKSKHNTGRAHFEQIIGRLFNVEGGIHQLQAQFLLIPHHTNISHQTL